MQGIRQSGWNRLEKPRINPYKIFCVFAVLAVIASIAITALLSGIWWHVALAFAATLAGLIILEIMFFPARKFSWAEFFIDLFARS